MIEREIMKREDYRVVMEEGFTPFKRRPELEKEFVKYVMQYAELDTGAWLREMDVLALGHAVVEPPVDVISFLRSLNKFLLDVVEIPDTLVASCEATTDEMIATVDPQVQFMARGKGPKIVVYGFSRVASNIISPRKFDLFWLHIKKIAGEIIRKGCIVLFHLDNDYTAVLDYFTEFPKGKTWFHLDQTDIFKAKEVLGDRACVMGNMPPHVTALGTPREVEEYCKRQIEGCMEGGGYMLCSSCVLPDSIPPENLKAMKEISDEVRVLQGVKRGGALQRRRLEEVSHYQLTIQLPFNYFFSLLDLACSRRAWVFAVPPARGRSLFL